MHTSIYNSNNFYVYLITDLDPIGSERYYIGSATRKSLKNDNIDPEDDTYYGSSSVKHLRNLQNTQSPQLERIIIETFSTKIDCRLAEEMLIKDHNAVRSSLFYNLSLPSSEFIGTSKTAFKGAQTKRDDVDAAGLNGLQRSGRKSGYTRLNTLDANGNNINELNGVKVKETITRQDKCGNTIAQNRTVEMVKTRSEVGLDGLTSYQRGGVKSYTSSQSTFNSDGVSNAESSRLKQKETKSDDIWKENIGDPSHLKAIQTMRNNFINGCDGIKRRTISMLISKAKNRSYSKICHKQYGCFDFVTELSKGMNGLLSSGVLRRVIKKGVDSQITKQSILQIDYLKSLNILPGTTWRDIGIYVI